MNPEQRIPETFVVKPERAEEQAHAEKPFRDKALELLAKADATSDMAERSELKLQSAFLIAQAMANSNEVARLQALRPTDESEPVPFSDDIETALRDMKKKYDHPVDEATVRTYEAQGIPRAILEMSNVRPVEELVGVRANRIALYRQWRAEGQLDDTLADDQHMLEDFEERLRLGKYDEQYPTELRLRDAVANCRWNIELIEEVLREERLPNEEMYGVRLRELGDLFASQLDLHSKLMRVSWKLFNDPSMRANIESLDQEWRAVEEEYHKQSYRIDWPQEFVERVRAIKEKIEALPEA